MTTQHRWATCAAAVLAVAVGVLVIARVVTSSRIAQVKVVVIGLDGASWHYMDGLLARGRLPHLAALREQGARATLRSVAAYVSPPAWTTLFSGYDPDRTKIHSFGAWDPTTRAFRSHTSADIATASIWDIASDAGKRVAVVNVPVTYPATPVNGIMLAGLLTPGKEPGPPPSVGPVMRQAPPAQVEGGVAMQAAQVESERNGFAWVLIDSNADREPDTVQLRVTERGGEAGAGRPPQEMRFAVGDYSPWLRVQAIRAREAEDAYVRLEISWSRDTGMRFRFSGVHYPPPEDFAYPREMGSELAKRFRFYSPTPQVRGDVIVSTALDAAGHVRFLRRREDWDLFAYVFAQTDMVHHSLGFGAEAERVYEIADAMIGEIWRDLDGHGVLAVVSDHGFGEYALGVDLNRVLERLGFLRWRDDDHVDLERSLVFHNFWHLYFNEVLLDAATLAAHGVAVRPGQRPRDALAEQLRERLATAVTDHDGSVLPIVVTPIIASSDDPDAPDLVVQGTYERHLVEYWGLTRPHREAVFALEGWQRWHHARDGVLLLAGPGIRAGADLGMRSIADVAPTLCALLGLPVARDFSGTVIADAFAPGSRREPAVVASFPAPVRVGSDAIQGEQALEDALRRLGYAR